MRLRLLIGHEADLRPARVRQAGREKDDRPQDGWSLDRGAIASQGGAYSWRATLMGRHRRVPLYHDRETDVLVSYGARDAGDSRCPFCGGHQELREGSAMVCEHCGGRTVGARP